MYQLNAEVRSPMDKFVDWVVVTMFSVAAVAGASGACLVMAHKVLRGRNISALLMFAYAIVGGVLAVAMMAYLYVFMDARLDLAETVLYSIGAGAIGSMSLAATNLTARFIMRHLGIEVEVTLKPKARREK